MEIREIIKILAKRWIMVVLFALVSGLLAGFYAYNVLENQYQSTVVMIINSNYSNADAASENQVLYEQDYNIKLVNSYQVLCQTRRILEQVIQETNIQLTVEKLSSAISVSSRKDTPIIDISVMTSDPVMSANIANSVANVFMKEVPLIMKMNNVQVIDYAQVSALPSGPDRLMIAVIGIVLGLLRAC